MRRTTIKQVRATLYCCVELRTGLSQTKRGRVNLTESLIWAFKKGQDHRHLSYTRASAGPFSDRLIDYY